MKTPDRPPRLPSNHRLVYDVVKAQKPGCHLAAGEIFTEAKGRKPGLGYSTVYRALERLCTLKLVQALHVPGVNGALYEPAGADHAHFVCRVCGHVEDIDCDVPLLDIGARVTLSGGEVGEVSVTVHGRCGACCRAEADRPPGA